MTDRTYFSTIKPMSTRNLNPYTFFAQISAGHTPTHTFSGRTKQQFQAWKRTTLRKVLATLGRKIAKVNPRPQLVVEWQEHGLIKQRWLIDTQPGLSASVLLFRPLDIKRGQKRPAILCCHGHGPFGKDAVMGIACDTARAANIKQHNYDYGLQMAQAGFVTYSLDWLGFGERSSQRKPHTTAAIAKRDPCNIHYLCATMLGTTVLALDCHDGSAATEFVCAQPFVDPRRLGVMGLSFGGTMTTWMMLTDPRFAAADIIGYSSTFHAMTYQNYNSCGSQITPGLFELVDMADLQGLIAPKPLLLEVAIHDSCFLIDPVMDKHWPQLERIYKTAGAADAITLDLHPNEHAWGANKSLAFFRDHLKADW